MPHFVTQEITYVGISIDDGNYESSYPIVTSVGQAAYLRGRLYHLDAHVVTAIGWWTIRALTAISHKINRGADHGILRHPAVKDFTIHWEIDE